MNVKLLPFACFCLLAALSSCKPATTETTVESASDKKDMSGLTYYDLIKWVFEDDGEGYDWQGETLPNDYLQVLTITNDGTCGDGGCGDQLYISNSSADTLEVIVTSDYDLEGDVGSIARKYVIPANGKLSIGCSHLCFDETPYSFERKIIGSKIFEEVPL